MYKDNKTLLRVEKDAGHGAGKSTQKIIQDWAETFAFIEKAVGPVDQTAYKAELEAKNAPKPESKVVDFFKRFKP